VSREHRQTRLREAERDLYRRSRLLKVTPDGLELWGTPRGFFWMPANFGSFFYILAEQEIKIYSSDECAVRKGDIVLDCGANVGVFTGQALAAGARLVIAIEPGPKKTECLSRNFEAQIAEGRVVVCRKGVWNVDATLQMSLYKNAVLDSFVLRERSVESLGTLDLPVTTIDHLVSELKLPRVDFIKMDIEGANSNALAGATATLAKFRPRLAISTEDVGEDYMLVPPIVREASPGYRCVPGQARLKSRFQITPDVLYFW
jgi:FkbM family methyltransferase